MNARRIASLVAVLALVATVANAGPTPTRGWQKTIKLEVTKAGVDVNAQALAVIGKKNGVEYFGVRVFANLKDGTVLTVMGEDKAGNRYMIGTMEIFLTSADLYLESKTNPSDVFPVLALARVSVDFGADEIVFGSF